MNSGTSTLDAAAVLAAARAARKTENAAAADVLAQAVEWARLHEVTDLDDAATWWAGRGVDTGIPIAGEGAPLIAEFAVAEFATALGMTAESGRKPARSGHRAGPPPPPALGTGSFRAARALAGTADRRTDPLPRTRRRHVRRCA